MAKMGLDLGCLEAQRHLSTNTRMKTSRGVSFGREGPISQWTMLVQCVIEEKTV